MTGAGIKPVNIVVADILLWIVTQPNLKAFI